MQVLIIVEILVVAPFFMAAAVLIVAAAPYNEPVTAQCPINKGIESESDE